MNIKDKLSIKNILLGIGLIGLIVGIVLFIRYKMHFLDRIVLEQRNDWDIMMSQDTFTSGDYMGKMYEKNYTIDTIPKDLLSSLVVDYYIMHDDTFFNEENLVDTVSYQKRISKSDFDLIIKQMLGPNYSFQVQDIQYGCGRSISFENDYYVIRANDIESCGVFGSHDEYYFSHISNYHKEGDKIIIELRVGYVTVNYDDVDDNDDTIFYRVYTDKSKNNIISDSFDDKCLLEESVNDDCYNEFKTYLVTLKKASDGKYYFYQLSRDEN